MILVDSCYMSFYIIVKSIASLFTLTVRTVIYCRVGPKIPQPRAVGTFNSGEDLIRNLRYLRDFRSRRRPPPRPARAPAERAERGGIALRSGNRAARALSPRPRRAAAFQGFLHPALAEPPPHGWRARRAPRAAEDAAAARAGATHWHPTPAPPRRRNVARAAAGAPRAPPPLPLTRRARPPRLRPRRRRRRRRRRYRRNRGSLRR
jgi:hypothetical protein